MKKYFFFKEYNYYNDFESKSTGSVSTVEVNFEEIEKNLPIGSVIKHESVQTVVENGKFIVFGEYTSFNTSLDQTVAKESIHIDEVLGEGGALPSVN